MSITRKLKPTLSLIIPVYNEQKRLTAGVSRVLGFLRRQSYRWELIIVDDGSRPPASRVLERARAIGVFTYDIRRLPVSIIRLPKNKGKGAAIGAGVARARGRYVVFCDVDMSVPIGALADLMNALLEYPMVIASRRLPNSVIATHQPWMREGMGRVFTMLSNGICRAGVKDATCGMKGYRVGVAKKLFGMRRIDRWVFDTELLFLARRQRISIGEIPITWHHKNGSKVKGGDAVQSLVDLLRIRYYDATGKYTLNKRINK